MTNLTQKDYNSPVFVLLEDWLSHGTYKPNGKMKLTRAAVDAGLFTRIKSAKIINLLTGKTEFNFKAKNIPGANLSMENIPNNMLVDKSLGLGTIHSQIYDKKSDLKCTRGKSATLEERLENRTQKKYVVKIKFNV